MLKVTLGTRLLGISFEREVRDEDQTIGGVVKVVKIPIALYCNLHRLAADGKSEAIVARTRARCSAKESFRYEVGRRIALARALKQYGLARGERTVVWESYLNRPRPISTKKEKAQPVEEAITLINVIDDSPSISRLRKAIESIPTQQADGYREPVQAHAHLTLNAGEME